MITAIHTTVATLLRDEEGFPGESLVIDFCPPTSAWLERAGPRLINFYLLGLRENTELRRADMPTLRSPGQATRRVPPRLFDARYVVTAYDKEDPANEYALLWATLSSLLRHETLPTTQLPTALRELGLPVTARVLGDETIPLDLWSLLGQLPRPALSYSVTIPVELVLHSQHWGLVREAVLRVTEIQRENDGKAHDVDSSFK
jgi:hypothetical protein